MNYFGKCYYIIYIYIKILFIQIDIHNDELLIISQIILRKLNQYVQLIKTNET